MTKFRVHNKKGAAAIVTAVIVLAALSIFTACSNAAQPDAGGSTGTSSEAPFVEGGTSFILSPDKLDITVKVITSDGTSVTVEGCKETALASGTYTQLRAKSTRVILKGKITELDCSWNRLIALNVRGLISLQNLQCSGNRFETLDAHGLRELKNLSCKNNELTVLSVEGCTSLQELNCSCNQLTALSVRGLPSLQKLICFDNRLIALNVQGCTALRELECNDNLLADLNVSGLPVLRMLECRNNRLADLNLRGMTALKKLHCHSNKLNAQALIKLFNDLPTRIENDYAYCFLYTEQNDVPEGNHKDFTSTSSPAELKQAFEKIKNEKKWTMYKLNGSGSVVEI